MSQPVEEILIIVKQEPIEYTPSYDNMNITNIKKEIILKELDSSYGSRNKELVETQLFIDNGEVIIKEELSPNSEDVVLTGDKPRKCHFCHEDVTGAKNTEHHSEQIKRFKCRTCTKSFNIKNDFKSHILTHKSEQLHKWHICGERFERIFDLNKQTSSDADKLHTCKVCGKSFEYRYQLHLHSLVHTKTPYKSKVRNKVSDSAYDLRMHRPHKCKVCGRGFRWKKNFMKHRLLHSVKAFRCSTCNKAFYRRTKLRRHMLMHTDKSRFDVK